MKTEALEKLLDTLTHTLDDKLTFEGSQAAEYTELHASIQAAVDEITVSGCVSDGNLAALQRYAKRLKEMDDLAMAFADRLTANNVRVVKGFLGEQLLGRPPADGVGEGSDDAAVAKNL